MALNKEKQEIINCKGNVLVTANPGTGKTFLLANKYVNLLNSKIKPSEILCLTFTRKARREMEERISKLIKKENLETDLSELNVHTFHSYALDNLDESNLVSTNLLRYSIFRYLKDNETLNYGDSYLLSTIVPKMENLIRYLKSFGIKVSSIDVNSVKDYITDFKKYSKEELEDFLNEFVKIYSFYEETKGEFGLDYSDMLIDFLDKKNIPKYKFVLVDELQDVNGMEADIALKSAERFIAVGDQKQAIFGFQGGSILNFEKFKNSTSFVLSENFRSTNPILFYSRDYFSSKTKEKKHALELKNLRNNEKKDGEKPIIFEVSKDQIPSTLCKLVKKHASNDRNLAVIARTNSQIKKISDEFYNQDIDHSSTFFSGSSDAQNNIITFLKGIFSKKISHIKSAMFTPFFPISMQNAFSLCDKDSLEINDIYKVCPSFKKLRTRVTNTQDVNKIFKNIIIPISVSYGEDYLTAAIAMRDSFFEAIKLVSDKKIDNICAFLESTDILGNKSSSEKNIVLTTVHKAKGKQFDKVIYVPSKTSNRENFQDAVVTSILKSKGINAEEELSEETLRVDFVAFTRAKENLMIVTDKASNYSNSYSKTRDIETEELSEIDLSEKKKRAFSLFVNKEFDKAKEMLSEKDSWLRDFVKNYFESLDHISFSALKNDPYEFLVDNILKIREYSDSLSLGSKVHSCAENILECRDFEIESKIQPYKENIEKIVDNIYKNYSKLVSVEEEITIPLKKIVETDYDIDFTGKLDCVFKNDKEYFIVDWKTSKNDNYSSSHRRQLSVYKKAYSEKYGIHPDEIKVAIAYVGLRKTINDGKVRCKLDDRQPTGTSFKTFCKHMDRFLSWKKDADLFFKELCEVKKDEALLKSVVEQYKLETKLVS